MGRIHTIQVGLTGGEDFEMDNPCDVLALEEVKAAMCFVSEDVDKDNAKMGESGCKHGCECELGCGCGCESESELGCKHGCECERGCEHGCECEL